MANHYRFFDYPPTMNDHTQFILIGIPFDGDMTQNRGICTDAPDVIRRISLDLSLTSESGIDLNTLHMADVGNVRKDITEPELIQEIGKFLENSHHTVPIFIGGSHNITYYTITSLLQQQNIPNLHYISLDAHLDCYDEWNGNKYTHCTVTRRIFETLGSNSKQVYVIGARDIDLPELEWAHEVNLQFFRMYDTLKFDTSIKDKPPVYLSVDIDVFDPSVAPATGYPIPGGISYRDYLEFLPQIVQHFTIVGLDFVEYSPILDLPNKMTAFLIAKLIIETMVGIKKK
ncbi:MAG: arginase family protein [Candidatus Lokiarchaeota archaeon]|nr:arginase family protein [Candidatus Lokiarchaeota archaeon]